MMRTSSRYHFHCHFLVLAILLLVASNNLVHVVVNGASSGPSYPSLSLTLPSTFSSLDGNPLLLPSSWRVKQRSCLLPLQGGDGDSDSCGFGESHGLYYAAAHDKSCGTRRATTTTTTFVPQQSVTSSAGRRSSLPTTTSTTTALITTTTSNSYHSRLLLKLSGGDLSSSADRRSLLDDDGSSSISSTIQKRIMKTIWNQVCHSTKEQFHMIVTGELSIQEYIMTILGIVSMISSIVLLVFLLPDLKLTTIIFTKGLGDSSILLYYYSIAWFGLLFGPIAILCQRNVHFLQGMKSITNDMTNEVELIQSNNVELRLQNKRLQQNTARLESTQATLAQISEAQGVSIDTFIQQVKDYQQIQKQLHLDVQGKIQQTILSVIERCDQDINYQIDSNEMNILIKKLKLIPGVTFDEQTFRTAMEVVKGDVNEFTTQYLSTTSSQPIFEF